MDHMAEERTRHMIEERARRAEWREGLFGSKVGVHKCRHPQCQSMVPTRLYACKGHWYELPVETRNRIIAGYKFASDMWYTGHEAAQQFWKIK